MDTAIRPQLPHPKIVEHAAAQLSAIRPKQPAAQAQAEPVEVEFDDVKTAKPVVDTDDDEPASTSSHRKLTRTMTR